MFVTLSALRTLHPYRAHVMSTSWTELKLPRLFEMAQPRPSSFGTTPEQEAKLDTAQSLHTRLDKANLHILRYAAEFKSNRFDSNELEDTENIEPRDPAIVAADVGAQLVGLERPPYRVVPLTSVHSAVILAETQIPVSGAEC